MTPESNDLRRALDLLKFRPEIARDLLVMAGAEIAAEDFSDPTHVIKNIMRRNMLGAEQEMFMIFAVDVNGAVIDSEVMFRGDNTRVSVYPKILLRWLLTRERPTTSFYVAHNHPISSSKPSKPDFDLTDHLLKLSVLVGILLEDHLIHGVGGNITSMRNIVERNVMLFGNATSLERPSEDPMEKLYDSIIKKMSVDLEKSLVRFDPDAPRLWPQD